MSDKSLRDLGVVLAGTGWPHGDDAIRTMLERCHQSEALRVIDELIEQARTMGIASRFREDRYAGQLMDNYGESPPLGPLDIIYGGGGKLSEKGHKRASLLITLQAIRGDLLRTFSQLAQMRLDMEAANMESDGSHAAQLTEEELRRTNMYPKLHS